MPKGQGSRPRMEARLNLYDKRLKDLKADTSPGFVKTLYRAVTGTLNSETAMSDATPEQMQRMKVLQRKIDKIMRTRLKEGRPEVKGKV